jgi:hypothetical protein
MLERSPIAESESTAQSGGELALPRLSVLLSQQEKLLEHPLSDADLYLYDLRAQRICDLIAQLENNRAPEGHDSSPGKAASPATIWGLSSIESAATKRHKEGVIEWVAHLSVSGRKLISRIFARIRSRFLCRYTVEARRTSFHRQQSRTGNSGSRGRALRRALALNHSAAET